jgi:hypothetical protein
MRAALFFASVFFGVALSAHAQVSQVQFAVTPDVPGPNQSVTIEAEGIGGVLGSAIITWQLNGRTVLSGAGETSYTFSTGGIGSRTQVRAIIESSALGTITRDFSFSPSTIHLLWEANTSAPPFYRGKSLYSAGAQVKVVATPQVISNGSFVSQNSLSFQWKVNGDPVVAQSGLGRNVLTFAGNQLRTSETVGVDVYLGSSAVGSGSVVIPATTPQLLVYVEDPLRGTLYDQALPAAISLAGKEVTLKAEPYYFSNESLASGALSYSWSLNNQTVTGPDSADGILTLRQTGSGGGEGVLDIALQNADASKLLQAASARIRLVFGASSSGASSFGI